MAVSSGSRSRLLFDTSYRYRAWVNKHPPICRWNAPLVNAISSRCALVYAMFDLLWFGRDDLHRAGCELDTELGLAGAVVTSEQAGTVGCTCRWRGHLDHFDMPPRNLDLIDRRGRGVVAQRNPAAVIGPCLIADGRGVGCSCRGAVADDRNAVYLRCRGLAGLHTDSCLFRRRRRGIGRVAERCV